MRYQNVPHSKEMRIRERMPLVAPDTSWNEITIDDPSVLEKPWTFTFAYQRMKDYTLLEYICEDNREYADDQGFQTGSTRILHSVHRSRDQSTG